MKTIWVRIFDGKNVSAVSTKEKVIRRIQEREDCSVKEAKKLLENGDTDWQEISLD